MLITGIWRGHLLESHIVHLRIGLGFLFYESVIVVTILFHFDTSFCHLGYLHFLIIRHGTISS